MTSQNQFDCMLIQVDKNRLPILNHITHKIIERAMNSKSFLQWLVANENKINDIHIDNDLLKSYYDEKLSNVIDSHNNYKIKNIDIHLIMKGLLFYCFSPQSFIISPLSHQHIGGTLLSIIKQSNKTDVSRAPTLVLKLIDQTSTYYLKFASLISCDVVIPTNHSLTFDRNLLDNENLIYDNLDLMRKQDPIISKHIAHKTNWYPSSRPIVYKTSNYKIDYDISDSSVEKSIIINNSHPYFAIISDLLQKKYPFNNCHTFDFRLLVTKDTSKMSFVHLIDSHPKPHILNNFFVNTVAILEHLYRNYNFHHFDLHANNILVNKNDYPLLFDFGMSSFNDVSPNAIQWSVYLTGIETLDEYLSKNFHQMFDDKQKHYIAFLFDCVWLYSSTIMRTSDKIFSSSDLAYDLGENFVSVLENIFQNTIERRANISIFPKVLFIETCNYLRYDPTFIMPNRQSVSPPIITSPESNTHIGGSDYKHKYLKYKKKYLALHTKH